MGVPWEHVPHPISAVTQHTPSEWPTAEHLFQAMRLPPDHPAIEKILSSKNPMAAKFSAKACAEDFVVAPLGTQDLNNMRLVVALKENQHRWIGEEIVNNSGDRTIIEDVSSRAGKGSAMFWGTKKSDENWWEGQNWLGRIWMEIRDELLKGPED